MVRIVEADEDLDDPHSHPNPNPNPNPNPDPDPDPDPANHSSPPSVEAHSSPSSSISSDHTFHGFSPVHEPPSFPSPSPSPPQPDHPEPALVPVPVPAVANRLIRDHPDVVTKSEPDAQTGFAGEGDGDGDGDGWEEGKGRGTRGVGGSGRRGVRPQLRAVRRARGEKVVKRVALGLRVFEFLVCLVSFSVMAADNNQGWALDSFHRYIEFRYSISVNIIGFAYSALQGLDLLLQLTTKRMDHSGSKLRCCFDFAMDQILAYLLLSASSSAFTRVDDWISNWGQDKFPAMATASVGVSFLAFAAFAMSSLVSGYILCTQK